MALSGHQETLIVCVYSFCSDYVSRLTCCPFRYSVPRRNRSPPSDEHCSRHFSPHRLSIHVVEAGGIEPPSETPFTSLHTAIKLLLYLCKIGTYAAFFFSNTCGIWSSVAINTTISSIFLFVKSSNISAYAVHCTK